MKYICVLLDESGEILAEIPRESTVGGLIRAIRESPANVDTIGFVIVDDKNLIQYQSQFAKCDIVGERLRE